MSSRQKLLTIDDNKLIHTLVEKTVGHEFDIITALDGMEGLQKAVFESPDIILLDVEMPGMSGFDVCSTLKSSEETSHIPVMFLSSLSDERSQIMGFEVGAVDFLVKPFKAPELIAKLDALSKFLFTERELNEQATSAASAAFSAMRGSNEFGLAIHFIEASYGVTDLAQLANIFFGVSNELGLDCSLMFNLGKNKEFYSCEGLSSPMEREVMTTLYDRGDRFIDFSGCRTQVNYAHVALLIKNMPIEDEDKYGRYKDFLPTMLGATDAKIHSLLNEQSMARQTQELGMSFSAVQDTLTNVGVSLEKNQTDVVTLLQEMLSEFEDRIPTMGLEDDQEAYLINRLDTTITKAYAIIDNSAQTSYAFKTVSRLLEHLSSKQTHLMESMETTSKSPDVEAKGDEFDDVELF